MMDLSTVDLAALIGTTEKLTKVGHKGLYRGACRFCGGTDRFKVEQGKRDGGGDIWFCHGCEKGGDAIKWIQLRDDCDFPTACTTLGVALHSQGYRTGFVPDPEIVDPPNAEWRRFANAFVRTAIDTLWSPQGERAVAWLMARGLTEATIRAALIGYHPGAGDNGDRHFAARMELGLDPEPDADGRIKGVWLPRGIVIPWFIDEDLWRVEFRRPVMPDAWECGASVFLTQNTEERQVYDTLKRLKIASVTMIARELDAHPHAIAAILHDLAHDGIVRRPTKYIPLTGGSNAVYGVDAIQPGQPAALVEGALNVLALRQEAGDLLTPVGLGAATHGRRVRWLTRIGQASPLLVALDNDEDQAKGEGHAAYWTDALRATAVRWRPTRKDCGAMLQEGANLRAWATAGIEHAYTELAQRRAGAPDAPPVDAALWARTVGLPVPVALPAPVSAQQHTTSPGPCANCAEPLPDGAHPLAICAACQAAQYSEIVCADCGMPMLHIEVAIGHLCAACADARAEAGAVIIAAARPRRGTYPGEDLFLLPNGWNWAWTGSWAYMRARRVLPNGESLRTKLYPVEAAQERALRKEIRELVARKPRSTHAE